MLRGLKFHLVFVSLVDSSVLNAARLSRRSERWIDSTLQELKSINEYS
jgi:hypothetical protein